MRHWFLEHKYELRGGTNERIVSRETEQFLSASVKP